MAYRSFFVLVLWSSIALAHEFEALRVTSFVKASPQFYAVNVTDTHKDVKLVCALYDDAGELRASSTWSADNLATQVLVRYDGDDVADAKCVLN